MVPLQKEILPLTNSSDTSPESGPKRIITRTLTQVFPLAPVDLIRLLMISHGLRAKQVRQAVSEAL